MGGEELLNRGGEFSHSLLSMLKSVFHPKQCHSAPSVTSLLGPFMPDCCCRLVTLAQAQREDSGRQYFRKVN